MLSWIDDRYLSMKLRMQKAAEEFMSEEKGVSSFVATILLIAIVVGLCALFWTNISGWFSQIWAKITGKANNIGGL